MKNYFLKITACLMLTALFNVTQAQTTKTAPTVKATNNQQMREGKRVDDEIAKINTFTMLTQKQKDALKISLVACLQKFDNARASMGNDDSKLPAIKATMASEYKAALKAALSAEQYKTIAEKLELK